MLIDQQKDLSGIHLYKMINENPEIEDLVKEASLSEEEFNALPDTAFAWPEKRAFPIHNKEHTVLSMCYRQKVAEEHIPDYVDAALDKAAEIYDIPKFTLKVAAVTEPEYYLLPEEKKFRIKSASDIKLAEAAILTRIKNVSPLKRATAAVNLIKVAELNNLKVSDKLHKYAGDVACDKRILRTWLEARAAATSDVNYKLAYDRLSDELSTQPDYIRDRDGLVKLSETIYDMDKKANLTKYYDRQLLDPVECVFNTTEKLSGTHIDLNGKLISIQKLASHPPEFYSDILGNDIVREASHNGELDTDKLASIIETLPRDLKDTLARYL